MTTDQPTQRPSAGLTAYLLFNFLTLALALARRASETAEAAKTAAWGFDVWTRGAATLRALWAHIDKRPHPLTQVMPLVRLFEAVLATEAEHAVAKAQVAQVAARAHRGHFVVALNGVGQALSAYLGIELAPSSAASGAQGPAKADADPDADPFPPWTVAHACAALAMHYAVPEGDTPETLAKRISGMILVRSVTAEECGDVALEVARNWEEGRDVRELPRAVFDAITAKYPCPGQASAAASAGQAPPPPAAAVH